MNLRSCIRPAFCLAAVPLLIGGCQTTAVPQRNGSECRYTEWSTPRRLHDDTVASAAPAAYASLATTRAGAVFLVGNHLWNYGPALVAENPLSAWQLGAERPRSLGRPPGTFRFAYPQALVDSRDRLHLLWGEPAGGAVPIRGMDFGHEELTSIWTAVYDPEAGWSTPRPVFEARGIKLLWGGMPVPIHSQAQPRYASLSVPILPRGGEGQGILVLGFDNDDRLVASVVHTPESVAYSSVSSAGTQVFLGFIAPVSLEQRHDHDRNSVFLQASSDGGVTWRAPVLVSRSGSFGAYEVETLVAPDGTLHLVWEQDRPGGSPVYRHVQSRDGGRTWSAPDDLEAPPSALFLQAAVDRCGTLHLVWEHRDRSKDQAHMDYATRREGWSAITHMFDTLIVNMPVLHRAHDGRLVVAFQSWLVDAPVDTSRQPTTYSELVPRTP